MIKIIVVKQGWLHLPNLVVVLLLSIYIFRPKKVLRLCYSQRQILVLHNSVQSNPLWTLTKFVSFIFLSTPIRLVLFVFGFVFLALAGALEIGYRK